MKRKVFVDTSAWLALVNKSDAAHQKARKVRDALLTGVRHREDHGGVHKIIKRMILGTLFII
jgi:predicted nucleic acid-binding protein